MKLFPWQQSDLYSSMTRPVWLEASTLEIKRNHIVLPTWEPLGPLGHVMSHFWLPWKSSRSKKGHLRWILLILYNWHDIIKLVWKMISNLITELLFIIWEAATCLLFIYYKNRNMVNLSSFFYFETKVTDITGSNNFNKAV